MNSDESPIPDPTVQIPAQPAGQDVPAAATDGPADRPLVIATAQGSQPFSSSPVIETQTSHNGAPTLEEAAMLAQRVADLQQQEKALKQEIATLRASHSQLLQEQMAETQRALGRLVKEGLSELEQRKQALQIAVEQLERRQERIRNEMRTTFAGVSQELAIRVQGFKDYLVGSLQDLAAAAEQLELNLPQTPIQIGHGDRDDRIGESAATRAADRNADVLFADRQFQDRVEQIRKLLDRYRTAPDYYGPPWQLRRTFEPVHAERVSKWFFSHGGRGAVRTMGSRLQNILIASAAISVLRTVYGDRLRTLVIANTPERLGEWRRSLQDCLGISRGDFGPERGVVLFEEADLLAQKADRLIEDDLLPFIAIDETEDQVSLAVLQYPLWLAFSPNPEFSGYGFER